MRTRWFTAALALGAASSLALPGCGDGEDVTAPAQPGGISGIITSSVRGVLAGVTATAIPGGATGLSQTGSGAYTIANLQAGQYTLTLTTLPGGCLDPGPRTATVTPDHITTVDFLVSCFASEPPAPVQLTTVGGSHPTVSPDGRRIAFESTDGIATVAPDGGQFALLFSGGDEPDWARHSDLIALRGPDVIGVLNGSTGGLDHVFAANIDKDPAWSPDGRAIAFQTTSNGGDGIVLLAYPSGTTTRIDCQDSDGSNCDGEGPTWSPDGEWIAFEDGLEILKVRRTGGLAEIIVSAVGDVSEPAWSPDGRWIAFAREGSSYEYRNIWIVDARSRSTGLYQVTRGDFNDGVPAWSPDSRTVYFESDRSGHGFLNIWKVTLQP